ncbi:MAG: phosphoadenylyl-sulfate reductase [Rhizobiaceae bacterium]
MEAKPVQLDSGIEAMERAADLEARYGRLDAEDLIALAIQEWFPGEIAAVSSFGADSAVLLKLIANVDPSVPVAFLDTGKHFGETREYRDQLAADLGLANLKIIHPLDERLAGEDPDGTLHSRDTTACCDIRKVEPMARAVRPYRAWFTGRKRFQSGTRQAMPVFEAVGGRIRINPMAEWTTEDLAGYMRANDLRENPLVAYGYLSIGCFPCTDVPKPGEDARSGRWAGQAKTECGIHLGGLDASLDSSSL